MNKKKKRTYKVEDALNNPLIKPLIKTYSSTKTGDDKFDADVDKLMIEVQFARIKANRKKLSKQYGRSFDERIAEKETIKIGKAIMDMMSPKFAELMGFKKFAENGTKVLTNTNPNTKADAVVEVKGNQLNVEMGQKFQATTIGTNFPPQLGLNAYVKRKKLKYALDLPEAYLDDIKKGIVDLKVFDFQSVTALANTIGMLPQDLFIVACQYIVKRKKHYKDQMMIMLGTAVEELVELYNNRAEASIKKWDIKLSVRRFFKSAERIAWSKKYEYDWKSHVRFNEDFKEWRTIVSAKAVKKTN
jgi:hypothetical protein